METLGTLKAEISTLKEKPARRWESIITAIITNVVSFALGMFLRGL